MGADRCFPGRSALVCLLCALLLAGCVSASVPRGDAGAVDEDATLDAWVDGELTAYLVQQLGAHPRFKGEPFLLVRLVGADVQADIDGLTDHIRSRLRDALLRSPGARPLWRPAVRPWRHHRTLEDVSCEDIGAIHYYIGIEVRREPSAVLSVSVRALDLDEGSWVSGFGLSWRGRATRRQLAQLGRLQTDEYLRGLRVLPFTADQADLVAAYLARNLSCLLRQRRVDEAVVYAEPVVDVQPVFRTSLQLLGNYLARFREVRVTDDPDQANVIVRGEVHPIYDTLYQLWVVTRFKDAGEHLVGMDTAAYVRVAGGPQGLALARHTQRRQQAPDPPPPVPIGAPAGRLPIMSGLRVLQPRFPSMCGSRNPWAWGAQEWRREGSVLPPRCFALELDVVRAARVFLLRYHRQYRILRLLPASCRRGATLYHEVAAGETLRFPRMYRGKPALRSFEAGEETIYAIAVHDPVVAAKLGRELAGLPGLCGGRDSELADRHVLDGWLARLDALVRRHAKAVDWRSVDLGTATGPQPARPLRLGQEAAVRRARWR